MSFVAGMICGVAVVALAPVWVPLIGLLIGRTWRCQWEWRRED